MDGTHAFFTEAELDQRIKAAHREAAKYRLLASGPKERRLEALACRGRWLLAELGFRLVVLGAWLEDHGQVQRASC